MEKLKNEIKDLYFKYHKESIYHHSYHVLQVARILGKQYHLDIEKLEIAALLHDISAILSHDEMYFYSQQLHLDIDPVKKNIIFCYISVYQNISLIIILIYMIKIF